jgi:DNA polymerase III subunit gamma/tau
LFQPPTRFRRRPIQRPFKSLSEISVSRLSEAADESYRVLARKYRPTTFDELIGQPALVRTLTNAIASGRLAHAFLLTGVRGVGKTTTARIIARALNCVGPDGQGGPTPTPCGACEHCTAIAEDRHVDVIEMDAASRTGVADIRELIDGVRYRPTSARYKVYIIDEVHMLSSAAFNALLKTLEEPPPHVKFVFATTEIRKLPVTVLSRCQRFDLRRVDMATLSAHFAALAVREDVKVEDGALRLIARAADGSVRDGLSLLDQAIAHGAGEVEEAAVRDMLGLADRARIFDLFDALMRGAVDEALAQTGDLYAAGADPLVVLSDLLELTHWLTRLKVAPDAGDEINHAETERVRGAEMAAALSFPVLARTWQMLLKGLAETRAAPEPLAALEMALLRLAYVAELPTPAEAIGALEGAAPAPSVTPAPAGKADAPPPGPPADAAPPPPPSRPEPQPGPPVENTPRAALATAPQLSPEPVPEPELAPAPSVGPAGPAGPENFAAVLALVERHREMVLLAQLEGSAHLVGFEPGRIELRVAEGGDSAAISQLGDLLSRWTKTRWVTVFSDAPGEPTVAEQAAMTRAAKLAEARETPAVSAVLAVFPDAELSDLREPSPAAQPEPESVPEGDEN